MLRARRGTELREQLMGRIARRGSLALAGLLTVAGLQASGNIALAADTPVPVPGTLMPALNSPLPQAGVASASPDYVMYGGGTSYDETNPTLNYSVVRTSDGQTVHSFTQPANLETVLRPTLVRDSYVALVRPSDGHQQVDVRSATTGALTRSIDLTLKGGLIHADPLWALVAYSTGSSSGQNSLRIVKANGSTIDLPGNFFTPPTWIDGDANTAYITSFEGDFAIDIATGTKTELPFPAGTRIYNVGQNYLLGAASSGQDTTFRRLNRADLSPIPGTFTVTYDPDTRGFFPSGDGLVEAYLRSDAPSAGYLTLRPINTTTGARGADILPNAVYDTSGLRVMGDGRIALTISDTPGGRIGILANGSVSTLTELPDVREMADAVALNGTTVLTTWQSRDGIWTTPSSGSGSWSNTYPAPGFVFQDGTKPIQSAGDVVMSQSDHADPNTDTWRLSWSGGSRDILSDSAWLSHGGKYVSYFVKGSNPTTVKVEDAKTGVLRTSYQNVSHFRPIDGDVLWSAPNGSSVMTGTNLATAQVVQRSVPGCANGEPEDVRGRWAFLTCSNGSVDKVVDLTGALDPTPVAAYSGATGRAILGNGYIAALTNVVPATNPGKVVVTVTDLTSGEQHTYGYVRGSGYGQYAVNDDDTKAALAYIDATFQPRSITLPWVGNPSTPDVTPPVLTSTPTLAPAVASKTGVSRTLTWTWSGNPTTYDVRRGSRTGSNWTYPASSQNVSVTSSPTFTATIASGAGACFSARARDASGNVSSWSADVCQYVDGKAPVFGSPTGTSAWPSVLHPTVTYKASAHDDDRVASYDVQRLNALPGKDFGAWTTISTAGSSANVTTSAQAAGAEVCFRARARDAAGNVSAWAPTRCVRTPVDDRAMVRGARVVAKTSSIAVGGTYLKLRNAGSGVALGNQTGRVIGLWIIRAKGLGKAVVKVGGTRVATVNFAAASTRRAFVAITVPGGFTAKTIQVTNKSTKSVRVDAIAIAR